HGAQTQPVIGSLPGVTSGSFPIPLTGQTDPNQKYRVTLTVTDSAGSHSSSFVDVRPQTSTFTLATNVAGLTLDLDGQPVVTPTNITGVVNMTRALSAPASQTL